MSSSAFSARTACLALALLSSLTLTACGGDDAPAARVVGKNAPETCSYQPDDGDPAIMSNAGLKKFVKSPYFDKSYNRLDLEAVLSASGRETARYAKAIDIILYRIPYNGSKDRCLYQQDSVELAPDWLQQEWKDSYNGRLNDGLPGTDGFFVPVRLNDGTRAQLIVVRTSAERWTLVHELMHANFDTAREALGEKSGYSETAMDSTRIQISDRLNDFNDSRTEANLIAVADAYTTLNAQLKNTLVNSALEEIADESLLVDEYAANRLKFVGSDSAINAAWYINCSREKALARTNELARDIRSNVESVATSMGFATASYKARLILSDIADLNKRAIDLAIRAKEVSKATDKQFSCDQTDRKVQARLSAENPHLINMIDNNPGLRAFDKTMRELRAVKAKIEARNAANN